MTSAVSQGRVRQIGKLGWVRLAVLFAALLTPQLVLAQDAALTDAQLDEKFPPTRWEKRIAAMEQAAKDNPPPKDCVLFVGSSSIVRWDLKKWFPDLPAVNHGFGGSHLGDSVYYAERIVTPYRPATIVLYAGDNDLAGGKSPERVFSDYQKFVAKVQEQLPETRIIYIAIKPSIRRWGLIDKVRKANALIAEAASKDARLEYLDVDAPMLGEDGKPRKELFVQDGLHLSDEGYALWTKLLREQLAKKPAKN